MNTLVYRAVIIWLVIIAAETVHGILRTLLLVPLVGDLTARQIGVLIGSILVFFITFFTIDWLGTKTYRERLLIGALWVVLTVLFELSLGILVLNASWERIFSDYDLRNGGFMLFGLLLMFFSPAIAFFFRRPRAG